MKTTSRAPNALLLFAILIALTLFTPTVQSTDTVSKTPKIRLSSECDPSVHPGSAGVPQSFNIQAGQPVLTQNNVLIVPPAGSGTITSNHLQVVAAGIPASQIVYTLVSPLPAKGQVKLNGTLVGWLLNPSTGHYYTSTAPGHRGATASEAASYGAFLTTINNAAENVWITNNFSRALNAYNGLNDPGGWDNGESSAFRNWYPVSRTVGRRPLCTCI